MGPSERARVPPLLALACGLALVAFSRTILFPFVGWDDPLYVTQNPLVVHPLGSGVGALLRTEALGYPVPVVVLSFALDHAMFGFDPGLMHAENVGFHVLNVVLLFACARAFGASERGAGAAAILFAVHPLVVEPVCWVTGRKDLLATALVLAGVLVLARDPSGRSWRRWLGATLLLTLAILAKPAAVTAPVLLGLSALVRQPRPSWRAVVVRSAPVVLIGLVLGVAALVGQRRVGAIAERPPGAILPDVGASLAIQIGHLFWPRGFAIAYQRLPGDPSVAAMIAAAACVIAIAVLAWRHGSPVERAGLVFALVTYLPAAGVIQVNRQIADSYAYLPLSGIALAFGALVSRIPRLAERTANAAAGVIGMVLAFLSWDQASAWASPEAVWEADTRRYPGDVYGLMELARVYENQGRAQEAAETFERLDAEVPGFEDALAERAAWLDRGGRHARALELLTLGVRKGDMHCVRDYWALLLRDPRPPPPGARDAIARAFDLGFVPMRAAIDEPAVFERIAAILQAEHLDERAAQAHAQAAALEAERLPRSR